jgi:hypothetical protein
MGFASHWESDTLVIDVTNLNRQAQARHGGKLLRRRRAFRRLTLAGPDAFDYEATVEAPRVYARPWKVAPLQARSPE